MLEDIKKIIFNFKYSMEHFEKFIFVIKEFKSYADKIEDDIEEIGSYILCKIDGMPDLI